ncbi:MAG: EboA domain-containing protein [Planctomycetes bacterium]|nr:EboA domain-containing protein [Planctomycetota bacterium]
MTATNPREFLGTLLAEREPAAPLVWLRGAAAEIERGVDPVRFGGLISLASRYTRRGKLAPSASERARADELLRGWNLERWTLFEAARAWLVLARSDLDGPGTVAALEEGFAYADVGELCALHKTIALLPGPERFTWRMGEGCRSSMRAVYEAAACDTPYPALHFDDLAWRQLVIKALFVEAPLWRVHGLDTRLSEELARMALDLCDERRSAHRPVQHELWLVLGKHGGGRALAAVETELAGTNARGRRAAAIALARAGKAQRLSELAAKEQDPAVRATMQSALRGELSQLAFRALDPTENAAS